MRDARKWRAVVVAMASAALGVGIAACGSSNDSGSGTTAGASNTSGGADTAAVQQKLAPYTGHPSPFPVTEKLKQLPTGAKVAFVEAGTPIGQLLWTLFQPAAQTLGMKPVLVKAGLSAATVSSALDSVVALKPDAVVVTAINVELWKNQLKQLQQENIPVVTAGVTGAERYGIRAPQAAEPTSGLEGELLAYNAVRMDPHANVVVYDVPELPFTLALGDKFTQVLNTICPECSTRTVHVPVATIGNTAPGRIVSDLQANPKTTIAVFPTDEVETGLPSALQTAGIDVKTLGSSPGPTNLEYLKEGKETAALGHDLPVLAWMLADQAAREMAGQPLSGREAEGLADFQILSDKDITFDPTRGWTGYPDFAERFKTLWGVRG